MPRTSAIPCAPHLCFASHIDRLTAAIGRAVTWCLLAMVVVQVVVVLMRYVLGLGSIWLSETILYAHAALFMGAAAWTLQRGGHGTGRHLPCRRPPRTRALVDLAGALLLLPFVVACSPGSRGPMSRVLGDLRALARGERPAAGLPAQVADPRLQVPLLGLLLQAGGARLVVLVGSLPAAPAR